ncbi:MAG: hypothetical protein IT342_18455, partial [Candidatus Melainabacteria bacterium]|nr:hypothetical protein [Candidatus Melainabacteria bacterium]
MSSFSDSCGAVRPSLGKRSSTTPQKKVERQTFKITHPFHPLLGQEFSMIMHREGWGE